MNKYIFLFVILFASITLKAQVGINTNTPEAMLDINGNMQLRKDLKLSKTEGEIGDSGIKNSVLMSQGPGLPPQWVVTDGIYSYSVSQAVLKSDMTGITFTPRSKVDDLSAITENSSISGWKEFDNLTSDVYVNKEKNQILFSFQSTVQLAGLNDTPIAIVAIGVFLDDQLKATKTIQLFGKSYIFKPIEITGELYNLQLKAGNAPYRVKIAAKLRYHDFPLRSDRPTSSDYSVLIGHSSSAVDNTSSFMNESSLGISVVEEF